MGNEHLYTTLGKQCISVLNGYKKRLSEESPEYSLRAYCSERGINYHQVLDWTSRHGYYLRDIRAEVFGGFPAEEPTSGEMFVQFRPRRTSASKGRTKLKGISITFPNGVNLGLEDCDCEEVIALIDTYERRTSAKEAVCSL